ncbi:transglycosylase SLT domain-containing protein [uncultured Ferrimonas sp.]|uniref:transglycosylase SLT domain-containing protein n=1 Tax=uncultured Ferrimonas sp. TaxID=432640 RepID=UPI0026312368|nr:transglycosylase SLT domain-containing protein [uncultured Ferrimonas sp.]
MARTLRHWLGLLCTLTLLLTPPSVSAASIEQQRAWYAQAREALRMGNHNSYFKYRRKLDEYPLSPYLDYHFRRSQLSKLSAQQAIEVLQELASTPLYHQFKLSYLSDRGKRRRWQDFLTVSPEPPKSERLQCYYYRARLSQKQTGEAYAGANQLWLHGKSRDKACDPLFSQWQQAGQRSQSLIWQRMLLAYDARQYSLLRYLNSLLNQSYRQQGDLLTRLYKHPQELRLRPALANTEAGQQIVLRSLKKLARSKPQSAWRQWQKWQPHLSDDNRRSSARTQLYRSLLDNYWTPSHTAVLAQYGTDKLKQQRLRQTIFSSDWDSTDYWLNQLSEKAKNNSEWLFWRGYVALHHHGVQTATAIWRPLAQRRNYYGFMAAQQLGQNYAMQRQLPAFKRSDNDAVRQHPAFARIQELMALNKHHDAKQEQRWLLKRLSQPEQAALLAITHDKQWHFLTVAGTIQTKMWNALDWRFPTAYGEHFLKFAELRHLDMALLQAVARRESALYPAAKSSANAHGLMQLLPTTAKATAKKIGVPYRKVKDLYQPKRNIQLGSAYYRQLYHQYGQNRLLASAAYNAGPHRVKQWLKRSQGNLTAAQFVATIPYKETREYVEAILSYQLIYATLDQRTIPLMTDSERNRRY